MTDPKMTGSKTCSKCHEDKPVICFAVDKNRTDGLHSECRECAIKRKNNKHLPNRMRINELRARKLKYSYNRLSDENVNINEIIKSKDKDLKT